VRIPRDLFKNSDGPFFRLNGDRKGTPAYRDFEMKLADQDGLYQNLRDYLNIARPCIMAGLKSDALIVATPKEDKDNPNADPAMRASTLDGLCRSIFRKHIIFKEITGTGFPGLTRFRTPRTWSASIRGITIRPTMPKIRMNSARSTKAESSLYCLVRPGV
jgi:hypothetical protein